MAAGGEPIVLRDSTLREGLDTPHVGFSLEQRLTVASKLAEAGVTEVEVVAPSRVGRDREVALAIRAAGLPLAVTGLVYAHRPEFEADLELALGALDWVTLIVPLAAEREPASEEDKIAVLRRALRSALGRASRIGVGFPHSTQVPLAMVERLGREAVAGGASRITIYDTNGSGHPFLVRDMVEHLARVWGVEIFFHGHDDLGLATANALAAALGGARGLEVTVNGLGDRAGNASLEQTAMALRRVGLATTLRLEHLGALSRTVAELSRLALSPLAPVVGDYAFLHKSPSHLATPGLFEAFDPALVGGVRRLVP